MAGRGPVPVGALPGGLAVAHDDNVADNYYVAVGDPEGISPTVLPGTDVLTVNYALPDETAPSRNRKKPASGSTRT